MANFYNNDSNLTNPLKVVERQTALTFYESMKAKEGKDRQRERERERERVEKYAVKKYSEAEKEDIGRKSGGKKERVKEK